VTWPRSIPRSIPLAPRPFPEESVRSWIGRVAARYDLAPPDLLTWLRDGAAVHVSRLASLDWQEDAELEHLLARAAHLDGTRIRALRPIVEVQPKPALWYRQLLAWCPVCACEDVMRHGETYERAVWRFGCCAACPTHRLLLADVCPVCAFGHVGLQAVAGRQRLVCALCKRLVDALPENGRGVDILVLRWSRLELAHRRDWTHLASPFRRFSSARPPDRLRRLRGSSTCRRTASRLWCATWPRPSCGRTGPGWGQPGTSARPRRFATRCLRS